MTGQRGRWLSGLATCSTLALTLALTLTLTLALGGCGAGGVSDGSGAVGGGGAGGDAGDGSDAGGGGDAAAADTFVADAGGGGAGAGGDTDGGDGAGLVDADAPADAAGCGGGCDDGDACTDDSCVAGVCAHVANTAECDDGLACTAGDRCEAGVCSGKPVLWQQSFGGAGEDVGRAAVGLDDGGLFIAGDTTSKGAGGRDAWLLRVDVYGALVWDKVYGNELDQFARGAARLGDDVAVVGAWREHGEPRLRGWLHVVDGAGATVGSHIFAKGEVTELNAIAVGSASGKPNMRVVVAGYVEDDKGDYARALGRVDPDTLAPLWVKHYGDSGFDVGWDVVVGFDGRIAVVGDTALVGGDGSLSGPHVHLVEFDEQGAVQWQRTYFSDGEDAGWALAAQTDALGQNVGYTVAGSRKAPAEKVTAAWLMHSDAKGQQQWQQSIGAPGGAGAMDVARLAGASGDLLLAGRLAKAPMASEAALWRTSAQGATQWTLAAGAAGAEGHAVVAWDGAVGLVGASAGGKAADVLVVRASLDGKASCP